MRDPVIVPVDRLELSFAPRPWPFAEERQADISAYFDALQSRKPSIWNGRVLLLRHYELADGVFRGAYSETDFASYSAWRDWGRQTAQAFDCFSAGAVIAADGAAILGVMAAHTYSAGCVYFPCGSPDPDDLVGGKVDLDFSLRRELTEETGFVAEEFEAAPGWTTVIDGNLIAQIKTLRSRESAETLRARMEAHLAAEAQPEVSEVRIVRGPADFDPAMPRFVTAFLQYHFDGR